MDSQLAQTVVFYAFLVIAALISLTIHEFAHAWTALKFGDTTAYEAGRVSLNPLVHIDPVGLLCMFLVGFGWAKPTPVNPSRLNHPRADLIVSAVGPLSNFALAFAVGVFIRLQPVSSALERMGMLVGAQLLVMLLVQMNIALAVFNFLPIGPLDGSHVVRNLLPPSAAARFERFNHVYGSRLLLILLILGRFTNSSPLDWILGPAVAYFTTLILGS